MTRRLSSRLPWLLAASLALAVAIAPTQAQAQDGTFTSATGWMWGVATFELTLGVGLLIVTTSDVCQSWGCGVLALLVGGVAIGAAITAGLVTAANDTPPDIPFTLHNVFWGGLSGALGGFAFAKLYAASDSASAIAALSTAGVVGLSLGTYSIVRRDELMRERRTLGAAHFLAWGTTGAGLAALIALSSIDIPPEGAAILYALVTLIAYGAGIAWAETQIAKGDAGAATPMLGWSSAF